MEEDEYIPELTESAGIRLSVGDQWVMPFPQDDSILVAPGELTFVGVTMVRRGVMWLRFPENKREIFVFKHQFVTEKGNGKKQLTSGLFLFAAEHNQTEESVPKSMLGFKQS